jgi:four helix bundle protein
MTEQGKHRTSNAEHRTSNDQNPRSGRVFDLEERLLEFAVGIIRLVEQVNASRAANHVAAQLVRSGTSPLSNHGEAEAAESPADFVHKLRLCLKELRESRRWLRLIHRVPLIEDARDVEPLLANRRS